MAGSSKGGAGTAEHRSEFMLRSAAPASPTLCRSSICLIGSEGSGLAMAGPFVWCLRPRTTRLATRNSKAAMFFAMKNRATAARSSSRWFSPDPVQTSLKVEGVEFNGPHSPLLWLAGGRAPNGFVLGICRSSRTSCGFALASGGRERDTPGRCALGCVPESKAVKRTHAVHRGRFGGDFGLLKGP